MPEQYSTSNNRFYTALLFFASLVFCFFFIEILLRAIDFNYQLYPARVEFGWPNPVVIEKEFEIDREMLWLPKGYDDRMAKLYGTRPSIVYMGDSCTAWGAYDQALKQRIVEKHPNGSFSFINVGVGGWSSFQGLKQMERDVVRINPKVVTIYYGWNDHWASFGIEDKNVAHFNEKNPWSVHLSDFRLTQLANFFSIKMYYTPDTPRRAKRVSQEDFRRNLTAIVRCARDSGIIPVLLTAPTSHTEGDEPAYLASRWLNDLSDLVPLHREYVNTVRRVAHDNDVLLLDLFEIFQRLSPDEVKTQFFVADGIHLTSKGSTVVAHLLYRFLETNALIELLVTR